MTTPSHKVIKELIRIRFVEQAFLDLFSQGLMNGTVHTCIGQELSALAFAGQIQKTDFVFSNHRCHGHYMAYSKDWKGLILELMGKKNGVCGGVGSSQHLQYRNFYSNGIQGGIVPLASGFALGNKLLKNKEIGIVYIGDGTLGEGVVYESLNFLSKNNLPIIIVCENNLYAQSTKASTTTAGTIEGRAKAFGIEFRESHTFDGDFQIMSDALDSIRFVRENQKPIFHLVNTYRLKAHSKGDDDRDINEIKSYEERDFLNIFQKENPKEYEQFSSKISKEINDFIAFAKGEGELSLKEYLLPSEEVQILSSTEFHDISKDRLVSRINLALSNELRNERSILIGEDIVDPYGGAFKVTKNLSTNYPNQVIPTGISEGLIAGIANGLSLRGFKPIAEFMFGDFSALAFDQMLNHAAKVHHMYNSKVHCGVIFRTPMGGGRGYGPTHSQSIEKHFIGMDTFNICAVNRLNDPKEIFNYASKRIHPTLIIENKVDYGKNGLVKLPVGYSIKQHITNTLSILTIEPEQNCDTAIITYGGYVDEAINEISNLIIQSDLIPKIIILQQLDPFPDAILELIQDCSKIIFLEEGIEGGTVGDYFISKISQKTSHVQSFMNICSLRTAIPSVKSLEQKVVAKLSNQIISNEAY